MSLYITSLNSGSNGNCYYIGNDHEAVLIDAGISCRETEKRMHRLGLSAKNVKAIFISHEHSDHIGGVSVLARKYQIPVYITKVTLKYSRLVIEEHLLKEFKAHDSVGIGELRVTAFPKLHDASEPHSFTVSYKGITVGIFTDIGFPCEHVISYFKQCHAAFLEANYDEEMLNKGSYPYYLKSRISGGRGHLSNKQALEVFRSNRHPHLSHLVLSHLSKNNNSPELVQQLFDLHADNAKIIVASRHRETDVYLIHQSPNKEPNNTDRRYSGQYSLF